MRKNRVLKNGARYHVSVRVNNRELLLKSCVAKLIFVAVLKKAKQKYKFSVENYVIMGNHFHMIINPQKDESLSRIMQWFLSVFARVYNKRFGRSGHFWGERFFSRIINSFSDYLNTFDYIDRNPIVAGLVTSIYEWKFSGVHEHRQGIFSFVENIPCCFSIFLQNHTQQCFPVPEL